MIVTFFVEDMSNTVIIHNERSENRRETHSSMATAPRCSVCTLEPLLKQNRVESESDDNDPSE